MLAARSWRASRGVLQQQSRLTRYSFCRPLSSLATESDIKVPEQARAVVIGGGIIGSSVAYHLAQHNGWKDVIVLEQNKITSGTTWHAAGLMVTYGSMSETSITMRQYSRELYQQLEKDTGLSTGFNPCGFIELASDPDYLEQFRRISSFNRLCGVDVHEISPAEVKELFPLCNTDDILAGFYVKEDGRINPVDVTMAIAKGARMSGVRFFEGVRADKIIEQNGTVKGVRTGNGDVIKADVVVNCGGMWARQMGDDAGVIIPNQAAEHYYLITEPMEEVSQSWPVIEDPGFYGYYREEGGGIMVGLFEPEAAAWNVDKIPSDFEFGEINPDWARMTPHLEKAMSRVPAVMEAGVKKFFCGPESFTPDVAPIVGPAPELNNYFVAAGLNSIGILTGGGIGRLVAEWVVNGEPDLDTTMMNVNRFQKYQTNPDYRASRVVESLGNVYKCHYPTKGAETARGVKTSPFHDRLSQRGAYFKDVSGWEGADWFAPDGVEPKVDKLTWGKMNWFPYWEAEHRAAREGVIMMDMTFMGKYLVQGPEAGDFLNWISVNNVNDEVGLITYTQWVNARGKMEADVTVVKLEEDKFMVVVTDTMHRHVEAHMKKHLSKFDSYIAITDVTGAYGQLNIQGPKSRELLQKITTTDMSNESFPFRAARDIDVGFARVTCVRITYLGELGYELLIPAEHCDHVFEKIVEAGEPLGLTPCGLKALGSLRMEKGYRDYGHDMDNTDTVLECGLGFCCDFDKPGGFVGKDAVLAQKVSKTHLKKRLLQVLCKDPEQFMWHNEPVLRDGKPLGYIRAASYGHTLGGAVGLAMLEADQNINKKFINEGQWEVEINGKLYPAEVSLQPMYDPKMEKVRV